MVVKIERAKIKKVTEGEIPGWTTIELVEPTLIKGGSNITGEVNKITFQNGTINKKGKYDWDKEGRNINFESLIGEGRLVGGKIINQAVVIDNKDNTMVIEIEGTDKENVIDWIKDGFSISFDRYGFLVNPKGDAIQNVHKNKVNWDEIIYPAIRDYIRENPSRFYLSDDIIYDRDGVGNGFPNKWWCQVIPEGDERVSSLITIAPNGGRVITGTRNIWFINNNYPQTLEFNFFTSEQYEELKNLLPDNRACKVRGCYNNYQRFAFAEKTETKVENGLCGYHRAEQEGRLGESIPNENEPNNNAAEAIRIAINRAENTYQNSEDLTEINQAITFLENIKTSHNEAFKNWDGEGLLNLLKSKKTALNIEAENTNAENLGAEEPNTPPSTNNNTNSSLQTVKNNAIEVITVALYQESSSTAYNLQDINRDWKQKINESDSEAEVNELKNRVLSNIETLRKERQKSREMSDKLDQASGGTSEKKAAAIEEAEEKEGESSYQDNANKVEKVKEEYFQKDKEGCLKTIAKTVENKLKKYGLSEGELSEKGQKIFAKLKDGGTKEIEINEVKEIEKELSQEIGQKGTTKQITNLATEVEKILKTGSKEQIAELKEKLLAIINSSSTHWKEHQSQALKLLQNLMGVSKQPKNTSSDHPIPKGVMIAGAAMAAGLIILGIAVVAKRRSRKRKKK